MYSENTYILTRISTVDAIVKAISKSILNGDIASGTQLKEADLARLYKVSRHSVREAFVNMVNEGLLQKEINRGVFVPLLTVDDIIDIYNSRVTFEVAAVKILAEKGEISGQMMLCMQLLENMTDQTPWGEITESDISFHKAMVDSMNSQRTSDLFRSLLVESKLCITQSKNFHWPIETIKTNHRVIVEAIKAKDVEKARFLVRDHLESSARLHAEMAEKNEIDSETNN